MVKKRSGYESQDDSSFELVFFFVTLNFLIQYIYNIAEIYF